jgi:glycosyltransferase involved in cell wall biosynthesis
VRHADHFIAISQATQRDLQEVFGIPDERIDVVYHGGPVFLEKTEDRGQKTEGSIENPPAELRKYGLAADRYFVAFSSYDRRKNLTRTVAAFAAAAEELEADYRLVIIGRLPEDEQLARLLAGPALRERVVCTGPLTDFSGLLGGARALVYARLYEGFGLPILEAMAAGVPVITSNCSSMPEVAGAAALLVSPQEVDDIAQAMRRLAQDTALRDRLIAAGRERATQFSWARAAAGTLAVYRKLLA